MVIHLSIRAIAVHEGGHAVAYYLFNMPIESVSIIPDDVSSGRCLNTDDERDRLIGIIDGTDWETDPADHDRIIMAHLVTWYAGAAAEARHTGRSIRDCVAGKQDDESVWDVIFSLIPDPKEREQLQHAAECQALALVAGAVNWKAIEAIADALEREHQLDSDRVAGILSDALATGIRSP